MPTDDALPVFVERVRYRGQYAEKNVFVMAETLTGVQMIIYPYCLTELLLERVYSPESKFAEGHSALMASGTLDKPRLEFVQYDTRKRAVLPKIIKQVFGTRYADEHLAEFWGTEIYIDSKLSEWGTVADLVGPMSSLH